MLGTLAGGWIAFGLASGTMNGGFLTGMLFVVAMIGFVMGKLMDLAYGLGKLMLLTFVAGKLLSMASSHFICEI